MMVRYIGFLIFLLIFRFQELKNIAKIFPPREDFVDVCAAITLIQENYDLNTTDLAKGQIIMKNVSENISDISNYVICNIKTIKTFEKYVVIHVCTQLAQNPP